MADTAIESSSGGPEISALKPAISVHFDSEKMEISGHESHNSTFEVGKDSPIDLMLCDSGSRLVRNGFKLLDEYVMFINSGGEASDQVDSSLKLHGDTFYEGGEISRTNECIMDGGDYPFIYESVRFGNFSYSFNNLQPGEYFVDLHFAEIIFTNGPKGMRVFDVFIQEEKVLSEFDIFHIVGANKPLQLVDSRASVREDGLLKIRFEGVNGSPVVSAVCIRRASKDPGREETHEYLKCDVCAAEIKIPPNQKKLMQRKLTTKYEKDIEQLSLVCKRKTDECYEAWMSLTATNEQLERVRMELDNKTFDNLNLEKAVHEQANSVKMISTKYENDKQFWTTKIGDLYNKMKVLKRQHSELSHEAHHCADSIPDLNSMVYGVQSLVSQCEDLKLKYREEQIKRRKLYNQLQETKGNIRVFCRCRPLSKEEALSGSTVVAEFDSAKDGDLGILVGGSTKKTFKFDRVFTPKDDQVDVFADASPLVVSVLDGYNVCIFAYGQTGTGKTFTMEGTEQNRGVNYRTLERLFEIAKEKNDTFSFGISVSVLEVYNEQIRDLLAASAAPKKLEVKQASEGYHAVPGIVEAKVENIREAWDVLKAGSSARAVGSNNVNEHSSRSHCMLCIMVRSRNLITGECTRSKLWLVDLAGSERLAKTDLQGERLKEAQNINKSLSALGDVVSALANRSSHIPYRNSKLTHLLQDSLGGDSKTLMFVQISPSDKDLGETVSSLNFATRVRGVELGPAKKQVDTNELQKLKTTLDKVRHESRSKDESLRKLEENMQNIESKAKSRDQVYKSLQEKIKEVEGQLEVKSTSHNQLERQVLQLSEKLKGREETCSSLQEKVNELERKIRERDQSYSALMELKVKNLESKLKEQVKESEHHSLALQEKIIELQREREEKEQSSDSTILQQKIKELEDKLMQQQEQEPQFKEITVDDINSRVLRSSNLLNRPVSQGSSIGRTQEQRRKRTSRSGESENCPLPSSLAEKRGRKSDPPKIMKVVVKKPVVGITAPQVGAPSAPRRTSRGQVVPDPKKKIWSR